MQIIGLEERARRAMGSYMTTLKRRVIFLADTTVNVDPNAEELASIAIEAARVARQFDAEPRVAMLSFSNFGSTRHPPADHPFSRLKAPANVLVFADLQSVNIAYKLLQRLSDAEATGPILKGMAKPVHILQRGPRSKPSRTWPRSPSSERKTPTRMRFAWRAVRSSRMRSLAPQ